eukprot:TRINITY_DN1460_c0_g1_i8.p1 TRINITY_DN1460_c0_g1~~TRINITY_DN1460_c0_g1_i8.p1  ORF type:complete len:460 (-),score=156.76 TRINITY_DN1460_c0_g1_i8:217-1596(-)
MEFAEGGDLLGRISSHKRARTSFSEGQLWHMFIQMVLGLKALHELKICHRDIKCANVFLTKNNDVKLGDLNVSKVAKQGLLFTQTGTPYYASPEVWSDKPYNEKSDMWSLGCVLYEAAALNPPFRATDMKGLYSKVLGGKYPPIPGIYSADLAAIVKNLLQVKPALRPSCSEILKMPMVERRGKEEVKVLDEGMQGGKMLETIILPRNLHVLSDRLPKPNYKDPLKRCPSIPEAAREEEAEKKVYHSHQPTPANVEAQKKALEKPPQKPQNPIKEKPREIPKQVKPVEQAKNQLPPRTPAMQNQRNPEQRGRPPIQQPSKVPQRNLAQKPAVKGRSESSQRHNRHHPRPIGGNVPLSARNNNKPQAEKLQQLQNPGNQKVQRRVASVGGERRQENNRKLVEYFKKHPVKAGINIKGLEDKKKPSQEAKKPPLQKKSAPHAAVKPSPANNTPNIYPNWWG